MNATILSAGCLELLPSFDMDRVLATMEAGQYNEVFCRAYRLCPPSDA